MTCLTLAGVFGKILVIDAQLGCSLVNLQCEAALNTTTHNSQLMRYSSAHPQKRMFTIQLYGFKRYFWANKLGTQTLELHVTSKDTSIHTQKGPCLEFQLQMMATEARTRSCHNRGVFLVNSTLPVLMKNSYTFFSHFPLSRSSLFLL